MTKRQKQITFGLLFSLSFFSSIYLNLELKAEDTAMMASTEMQSLPDINILKHLVKILLSPLNL